MIPPRDDYVLVLRRVPRNGPIEIQELRELVLADLNMPGNSYSLAKNSAWFFDRQSVLSFVHTLIKQGYLVGGTHYRHHSGQPTHVSLADSTKRDLELQPGIKEKWFSLPMSGRGILDAIANEASE